jgi:hypothetical protein
VKPWPYTTSVTPTETFDGSMTLLSTFNEPAPYIAKLVIDGAKPESYEISVTPC